MEDNKPELLEEFFPQQEDIINIVDESKTEDYMQYFKANEELYVNNN